MESKYLEQNPLLQWTLGHSIPAGYQMEHPEYAEKVEIWQTCRDANDGQHAVKKAHTRYLPKLSGQSTEEYKNYINRALYYNATGRTLQSYEGMIFRKDPLVKIKNNDGSVSNVIDKNLYYNNVTNTGKSLASLLQDVVHETALTNRVGILVDYPAPDEVGSVSQMTKFEKEQKQYKPLLTMYKAESIVNWHYTYINNKPVPTLYVLKEEIYSYNKGFFPTKDDKYRILLLEPYTENVIDGTVITNYRYKQIVMNPETVKEGGVKKKIQTVTDIYYPMKNGQYLNFIPFYVLTDKGVDFQNMENPIIYDLAELNISHYRNSADWENELHIVAAKTVYFPGWDKAIYGDPRFGGALAGPKDCTPSIIEASNKSGLADEMKAKEERMSVLGSEAISKQGRYVASAATAKISSKAEASILTTLSVSLSTAFSEILTFALEWDDKPDVIVEVSLNTDFYDEQVSGEELVKWMRVWQSGGMSFEAYYNMLESREVYPDGWSQEAELAAIREGLNSIADLPEERYMEVMTRIAEIVEALKLNESVGLAGIMAEGIPTGIGQEPLTIVTGTEDTTETPDDNTDDEEDGNVG